ncbi:MAG: hypothetical protein GU347_02655 [Desulfurococcales archaeon]|jgi:GTP cyclohydrolase FolE2|nr:hypothetical protein [Desulfurococcales archaeon]
MSNENASPDVHELTPDHPLRVDGTGLEGLYLKVNLIFRKSCEELPAELSLYIDLPPEKRGVHLSRLVKAALTEVETGCTDLSALLSRIAQKALNTHSYSEIAEVVLNSSLPLRGQKVDLNFRVKRRRNGKESWNMEVKLEGAISCPCAKEVFRYYEGTDWEKTPTHMQRAEAIVSVESNGASLSIDDAFDVIEVVESSYSGKLEVELSRDEEARIIKKIINAPQFAEDLARKIAWKVMRTATMTKANKIIVSVRSFESIHPYNVRAEVVIDGKEHRDRSRYEEL